MDIRHKEKIILLVLMDVVAMVLAFIVALALGHRLPMHAGLLVTYRWGLATLIGVVLLLFIILDIYALHHSPTRFTNQVVMIGVALFISAIITTFIFFFFRNAVPRAVFLLFFAFSLGLISLFRFAYNLLTIRRIDWKVLMIGDRNACIEVSSLIGRRPYLHSQVVGMLSDTAEGAPGSAVPLLGGTDRLIEFADREKVDQVIVASTRVDERLLSVLMECMKRRVKVSDFRHVIEAVSGRVPIEYLNDTWFIEELAGEDRRFFWLAKRLFDIAIGLSGIVVLLPFLPLIVAVVRIDSSGPAFYSQQRIGRGGASFRVWKLRTMIADADRNNVHWTTSNDARITRVGRVLRKLHVDELPQLYNILRGDMTLIGPRPEAASLVELYRREIPYYMWRHMVTPGVTGWAQINYPYGNSIADAREKLKYDFYYIKNRSIPFDILIFLRTIRTVVTGKGAL